MKFFRFLIICLLIAGFFLYKQNKEQAVADGQSIFNDIHTYVETAKDQPEISQLLGILEDGLQSLTGKLTELSNETKEQPTQEKVQNPSLETLKVQNFSTHNIEMW